MAATLWTPPSEWAGGDKKLATAANRLAKEAAELEAQAAAAEALRPPERRHTEPYPLTDAEALRRMIGYCEARLPLAQALFEHRHKADDLAEQLDRALAEAIADGEKARGAVIAERRKQLGAAGTWPAEGDGPKRGSAAWQMLHNHPDVKAAEASIRTLRRTRDSLDDMRKMNREAALELQKEIDGLPKRIRGFKAALRKAEAPPPAAEPLSYKVGFENVNPFE
jgi:hypothetical protein